MTSNERLSNALKEAADKWKGKFLEWKEIPPEVMSLDTLDIICDSLGMWFDVSYGHSHWTFSILIRKEGGAIYRVMNGGWYNSKREASIVATVAVIMASQQPIEDLFDSIHRTL